MKERNAIHLLICGMKFGACSISSRTLFLIGMRHICASQPSVHAPWSSSRPMHESRWAEKPNSSCTVTPHSDQFATCWKFQKIICLHWHTYYLIRICSNKQKLRPHTRQVLPVLVQRKPTERHIVYFETLRTKSTPKKIKCREIYRTKYATHRGTWTVRRYHV